jgi:hypothetical protein
MRQNETDQDTCTAISRVFHKLRRRPELARRFLITSCPVVCLLGLTWGVSAISSRPGKNIGKSASASPSKLALSVPAQSGPEREIRCELLTVFSYGFEPKEITRVAGTFILSVDNRADHHGLSLRLATQGNQLVQRSSLYTGQPSAHQLLNLQPGIYLLTEDNHPEWSCTITITQ